MVDERKAPEIRFDGFSGSWFEIKFEDFTVVSQGLQIAISNRFTEQGINKYFYITNEFLNPTSEKKYFIEAPPETVIATKNDILMTRTGNTGKVVTDVEGAFHNNFFKIAYNQYVTSQWFLYYLLNTPKIQSEMLIRAGNSTIPDLNHSDFYSIKVIKPKVEEQTEIGNFLRRIDDVIALKKQEHEKTVNIKKAMIEKMFPKNETDVPDIRFDGFEGAWDCKSLTDVADIVGGGTPDTSIPDYWGGNIDWYSPIEIGTKVYANNSQRKITELGLSKCSATVLPASKTILFTSRAGIGDMEILTKAAATNQGFQSLVMKDGYDVYFTYSMGHLIKDYALRNSSGSTFLEISGKLLGAMTVYYPPSLDEQTAIGNFFRNLDILIQAQQEEIEKIQNIKKACLNKMFI